MQDQYEEEDEKKGRQNKFLLENIGHDYEDLTNAYTDHQLRNHSDNTLELYDKLVTYTLDRELTGIEDLLRRNTNCINSV